MKRNSDRQLLAYSVEKLVFELSFSIGA